MSKRLVPRKLFCANDPFLGLQVFLLSCDNRQIEGPDTNLLKFDYFEKIGVLHNDFLTNVKENFQLDNSLNTLDERIDYINKFQNEFLECLELSDSDMKIMSQELELSKGLVDIDVTKKLVLTNHALLKEGDEASVYTLIDQAEAYNIVDQFEYSTLTQLSDLARMGYEGTISEYQFARELQKMKNDWISMGYLVNENCGYISGCAIAISIASIEWWNENPDAGIVVIDKESNVLVPVWAVSDAVGAFWGATSGAIGSYMINGEVKWGSVGFGALSGAVAGSTGVVGKVAKWITKVIS
ncbi:MAG: hypothetical protein RBT28_12370 [Bacteroidales bacterium]|jgi:hypothetical protein|nr:hypothetical protein [Bacteroidales bacterium]